VVQFVAVFVLAYFLVLVARGIFSDLYDFSPEREGAHEAMMAVDLAVAGFIAVADQYRAYRQRRHAEHET